MRVPYAIAIFLLVVLGMLLYLASGHTIAVLQPAGIIATAERSLMFHATLLMLIVIIPVLGLAYFFAWHYRASNTTAVYQPDWEHSKMDELVWWAIPFEIILVLGALTWTSTHELDPHRAIASDQPAMVIEVVALDWKWLFMYPEQHIATVNFVEMPIDRPVEFLVTADAPINSFWIPQLGGQIMAMTGMVNPLNLQADRPGDYQGVSANYSGDGFAHMNFTARAANPEDFSAWIASTTASGSTLSGDRYAALAAPGTSTPLYFGSIDPALYSSIVGKYMNPDSSMHH